MLAQLEAILTDAIHIVFPGLLVTSIVGFVPAFALPGGKPQEASRQHESVAA